MQRIGILSDIHGNVTALEAVIADALEQGVTEFWLLGDILLPGPGDRDVIQVLRDLPISMKVIGNWDMDFLHVLDVMEHQAWKKEEHDPNEIYFLRLSQYLLERLEQEDLDFLKSLPLSDQVTRNNLTFGISHNLPDQCWGQDLLVDAPQENFDAIFKGKDWDVAIYGHVHSQMMRYSSDRRLIINPGTIGQPYFFWEPFNQNRHAQYAILDLVETGIEHVQFRKVAYDVEKERARAVTKELPYLELYHELLDTGVTYHHHRPVLQKINQEKGYLKDIQTFFGIQ